jgi:sorbitol-specific phosphotransferase system component IIBC
MTTGEPAGGLESGLVASLTGSVRIAVVSGGVACLAGAVAVALALPALWHYDARAGAAPVPPPAAGPECAASAETGQ